MVVGFTPDIRRVEVRSLLTLQTSGLHSPVPVYAVYGTRCNTVCRGFVFPLSYQFLYHAGSSYAVIFFSLIYSMKKISLNNLQATSTLYSSCTIGPKQEESAEAPIHLSTAGTRDAWNRGFSHSALRGLQ